MEHINEIIDQLIKKKNEFIVRRQTVNLTAGSLGNPKISVGVLPFYDWSKIKKVTYVISAGRYLDCRMLCDRTYEKDSDYIVTNNYKKAKEILKGILEKYIEQAKDIKPLNLDPLI